MRKILIIGAGKSASFLVRYFLDKSISEKLDITIGDLDLSNAEKWIIDNPNAHTLKLNIFEEEARKKAIKSADIVVSMLPARFHIEVAKDCLSLGKHMVTASYVSKEMQALDEEAKFKNLVFLNEIGVDPGIDHMSAMQVIDEIKADGGEMIGFESYCGGLVATESDNNPWHYKISWNPRNIILAGQGGSATFKDNGRVKLEPPHRVFRRLRPVNIDGCLYKGYPNRDSLAYEKIYGLAGIQTLIRGTLRVDGFCRSWDILVQLGMVRDDVQLSWSKGISWSEWTRSFLPAKTADMSVSDAINATVVSDHDTNERLKWLGLFDLESGPSLVEGTPAQLLEAHLLKQCDVKGLTY